MYTQVLNIFDELLSGINEVQNYSTETIKYKVEDKKNNSYELQVRLPGYTKEDIKLNIENRELTLSYDGEETTWKSKFSKKFRLNDGISFSNITAKMEDGILYIKLPLTKEANSKLIAIN